MQTPSFSDFLFVSAALLNGAAEDVTAGVEDITATLFTPGLVNASGITFSESGLNVNVTFASTSRMLIGNGILCGGYGTTNGVINGTYTVNMASLVPVTGSVTAYIVGTAGQIGQQPQLITGPSPGHPDYDPTFVPSTQYLENLDTIYLTPTLTVPDNYTYIEICRVTLTAGQVTIPSVNTTHQYIANVIPEFDGNGSISGNWTVDGTLTANVGGALSGSLPNPGVGAIPGRFINQQIFSTPGTFTYDPTSGTNSIVVELVAGGGSGGATQNTGSGQVAAASGGGAGGWAKKRIISGFSGVSIIVGGGGSAPSIGAAGNDGEESSFGSIFHATGGIGGTLGDSTAATGIPDGGAVGGTGVNGDINAVGGSALYALYTNPATSSTGGASYYGEGGLGTTGSGNGNNGVSPGSGGGGGVQSVGSATGADGGAGAPGLVIVYEYT